MFCPLTITLCGQTILIDKSCEVGRLWEILGARGQLHLHIMSSPFLIGGGGQFLLICGVILGRVGIGIGRVLLQMMMCVWSGGREWRTHRTTLLWYEVTAKGRNRSSSEWTSMWGLFRSMSTHILTYLCWRIRNLSPLWRLLHSKSVTIKENKMLLSLKYQFQKNIYLNIQKNKQKNQLQTTLNIIFIIFDTLYK